MIAKLENPGQLLLTPNYQMSFRPHSAVAQGKLHGGILQQGILV